VRKRLPGVADVVISPRLLKRIFGDSAILFGSSNAKTTVYRNEFAIIEVAPAGTAIVDLKAPLLVCAAFDLTCEEVLEKLFEPDGVQEIRAYIPNTRSSCRSIDSNRRRSHFTEKLDSMSGMSTRFSVRQIVRPDDTRAKNLRQRDRGVENSEPRPFILGRALKSKGFPLSRDRPCSLSITAK
jgi:hypothetical protein